MGMLVPIHYTRFEHSMQINGEIYSGLSELPARLANAETKVVVSWILQRF
jgi:hypothetical protein